MEIRVWTWVLVGASFALYVGIGMWAKARSIRDFYVAERQIHPVLNGMATGADWMSAASFISMAGLVSFMGRDGSQYLMGWTGGYVLLAVLLAPYLRRYGKYTVPAFVGDRYYSSAARVVALLCAIAVSFTYLAGQVRGVGIVFARFLDTPIERGIGAGMAVVALYATLGGMKGITYAQVAQYCIVIAAYTIPAIFLSLMLTGNPIPQLGLGSRLSAEGARVLGAPEGAYLLEALDRIGADLGFARYTGGSGNRWDVLAVTATMMLGTAALPHVVGRFFTVPKIRDARSSAGWALAFVAVLYTAAPAVAAFSRASFLRTVHGTPYASAPPWFRSWEATGLVRFEDRNGDGLMQVAGDPARNEVRVDRDVVVLASPEMARLPAWVVALVAAGALGAALSTAAGLVLVIAAAISHDLGKGVVARGMSERTELWWARAAAVAAVLAAGWLALHPPGHVAEVVALAFALAASSLFPVLVLGVFWKRATKEGAIAGMACGLATTAAYALASWPGSAPLGGPPRGWLGISPQGFGLVGTMVGFAVTAAVSLGTRPPPPRVQELVARLRTPGAPPSALS